jgi:hypothetical protein
MTVGDVCIDVEELYQKRWDTVGEPCEGEDVTTLPVGQSTERRTIMFSAGGEKRLSSFL